MKRSTRIPDTGIPDTGIHLVPMPQQFCGGQMQDGAVLSVFSQLQGSTQDSANSREGIAEHYLSFQKWMLWGQIEARFLTDFMPRDVN